ncbi:hypothetical protein B296_00017721 [Ensete ventricosum]|uniref:Uncharacterized protein n=1 Tax=Ensete ventricosum TaxID=4639 RepID=A0A427AZP8_ENSVE|nr:hypothetical protein B296_00017721 [Ensete ventricosum]
MDWSNTCTHVGPRSFHRRGCEERIWLFFFIYISGGFLRLEVNVLNELRCKDEIKTYFFDPLRRLYQPLLREGPPRFSDGARVVSPTRTTASYR